MSDATTRARDLFFAALDHHNHHRYPQAESLYREALALVPDRVSVLVNLGAVLIAQEKFIDARAMCSRILAIEPDHPLAREHLTLCDAAIGPRRGEEPDDALTGGSGSAAALVQRAAWLREAGRAPEALALLDQALALDATDLAALMNRAGLRASLGRHGDAVDDYIAALHVAPDLAAAGQGFIDSVLKAGSPPRIDREFDDLLVRAISVPWASPQSIAPLLIARLRRDPAVAALLDATAAGAATTVSPGTGPATPSTSDAVLLDHRLLQALLGNALAADAGLERVLVQARARQLQRTIDGADPDEPPGARRGFAVALARQCFINGYVWSATAQERARVDGLIASLGDIGPAPDDRTIDIIATVAAYVPLHSLAASANRDGVRWPPAFQPLVDQQIREPARERQDRASIRPLTPISDAVSVTVRQQYEEHPYPRWTSLPAYAAREPLDAFLRRRVASVAPMMPPASTTPVRALNAGCGTGQHPIDMALRIADLDLLAIDLSLTSLAYARRKVHEMGLANIRFAQADILQMGGHPDRFDLIESTGVLHHLRDPEAGLAILAGLLAPGGIMRLALYSEAGRRGVVAARAHIAAKGYGANDDDIRQCRQDLMALPDDDVRKPVTLLTDFHAMSGCRDLLFHVQETRYDWPTVARLLADHSLELAGMELAAHVRRAFEARFPGEASIMDLQKWAAFEADQPDTFAGMYVFWVRRAKRAG